MKKQKRWIAAAISLLMRCTVTPISAFAMQPESNEEIIFSFLTEELQLNTATASGILANIYQESGFEPTASCIDTNGRISYGICQWNGGRFAALQSFCEQNGYAYDSLSGQLAYLAYDLQTTYSPYYYDTLLCAFEDSAMGAYDAAYSWAALYEVCNSVYWVGRAELARDAFFPYYEIYVPVTHEPVDLGATFYASIRFGGETAQYIASDSEKQLSFVAASDSKNKNWLFTKQPDGSYRISQNDSHLLLDGISGNVSMSDQETSWYLYETENGYVMQSAQSELVLQENFTMQAEQLQLAPSFQIEKLTAPTAVSLTVTPGTFPQNTTFQWKTATDTERCTISIWNGTNTNGTPLKIQNDIQNGTYSIALSAGTYTVVLQQFNLCGVTKGTPVTFTVTEQQQAKLDMTNMRIVQPNSNLVLTSTAQNTVQMQEKNTSSDQIWSIQKSKEGGYQIIDPQTGLALTANTEKKTVQLIPISEEQKSNQTWTLYIQKGQYQFYINGFLLTWSETEKTPVLQSHTGTKEQSFLLQPYSLQAPNLTVSSSSSQLPTLFQWNAVDGADQYQLEVQTESGTSAASVATKEQDKNLILEEGNYVATVQSENTATKETAKSEPVYFTVQNKPLQPVVTVQSGLEGDSIQMQWNDALYADVYDLRIYDAETEQCVDSALSLTGLRYQAKLPKGNYIVKVTARNTASINCATTSKPTSFSVAEEKEESLIQIVMRNKYYLHELESH